MTLNLKKNRTKYFYIPVWDCPGCHKVNMPLSMKGPFTKMGSPDVYVSFCPNCDKVVLDEKEIKGFTSIASLKKDGWFQGKVTTEHCDCDGGEKEVTE